MISSLRTTKLKSRCSTLWHSLLLCAIRINIRFISAWCNYRKKPERWWWTNSTARPQKWSSRIKKNWSANVENRIRSSDSTYKTCIVSSNYIRAIWILRISSRCRSTSTILPSFALIFLIKKALQTSLNIISVKTILAMHWPYSTNWQKRIKIATFFSRKSAIASKWKETWRAPWKPTYTQTCWIPKANG